jgi:hypothetical protein
MLSCHLLLGLPSGLLPSGLPTKIALDIWVWKRKLKNNKPHFYLYHEGHAKREPNEICPSLLDYTTNHVSETAKELRIISDSCPDQNRNHTAVRFLATLPANGRFNKIYQLFPVRITCDRDFGLIIKVINKINKVYTPEKYRKLIEQSSRKRKFLFQLPCAATTSAQSIKGGDQHFTRRTPKGTGKRNMPPMQGQRRC